MKNKELSISDVEIKGNYNTGVLINAGTITINNTAISGSMDSGVRNETTDNKVKIQDETNILLSRGTGIINNNSGTIEIDGGIIKSSGDFGVYNGGSGIVTIIDGQVIGNYGISNQAGIINVKGGQISSLRYYGISNQTGTINVTVGNISGSVGINNNNKAGIINIGEKDGNVSENSLVITGSTSGIGNTSGTFNYYDGKIIGKIDNWLNGYLSDVEDGYDINIEQKESTEEATLKLLGDLVAVNSATDKKYITIQSAIEEATDGETIEILKDIKTIMRNDIPENKNIIIDLKGNKIKSYRQGTYITNSGTLLIKDSGKGEGSSKTYGKLENTGGTVINNNSGILEINGTTITSGSTIITNNESGTLEINNSIITSGSTAIVNNNTGNITINSGTITGYNGINNASSEKVIINGGNVTSSGGYHDSNAASIINSSSGTIEINAGTIKGSDSYNRGIRNIGTGKIIVRDGTISGSNEGIENSKTGSIEIDGGNIDEIRNSGTAIVTGGNITSSFVNSGTATITGGNISGRYSAVSNGKNGILTIGIKDGSVNKSNPEIIGSESGVSNEGTFNFYDGTIKGKTSAISGTVTEIEEGYEIITEKQEKY